LFILWIDEFGYMTYLDYSDVLIKPKLSSVNSRGDTILQRNFNIHGLQFSVIPIIASNMDGVGTMDMARAMATQDMMCALTRRDSMDGYHPYNGHVWISIGSGENEIKRFIDLKRDYDIPFVNIDIANGYIQDLADTVKKIRELYPNQIIMAGNVATPDGCRRLAYAGADIIKIGIGPGSVCTTRIMTGVGVPQFSAILECNEWRKQWENPYFNTADHKPVYLCADGGCTNPGDIVKAFVAGADFVMLGGMLAGHKEGGATVENFQTSFYGSASKEAIDKHYENRDSSSAEGKKVTIPFRGDVKHTLARIEAGIRSAMTYTNSRNIEDLHKAEWIEVRHQVNEVFGRSGF